MFEYFTTQELPAPADSWFLNNVLLTQELPAPADSSRCLNNVLLTQELPAPADSSRCLNIVLLRNFLHLLPPGVGEKEVEKLEQETPEFQIDELFEVN